MDWTPWGGVVDLIGKVFDRVIPDPIAAANAKMEVLKLQQNGELAQLAADTELSKGQIEINKVEAANPNLFVSGWRPFIGWVCGLSLFTYYVPYCLVATYVWAHQCWVTGALQSRPDLGIADLIGLVGSMLGLASLRSYDKKQGTA